MIRKYCEEEKEVQGAGLRIRVEIDRIPEPTPGCERNTGSGSKKITQIGPYFFLSIFYDNNRRKRNIFEKFFNPYIENKHLKKSSMTMVLT